MCVHSLSENYEDITCCDQSEGLKQDHEQITSPWWGTLNSVKVCVAARQPRKIDFKRHKPDSRETESWKMKIKILDPGKLSPTVKLRKKLSPNIPSNHSKNLETTI